ncbi:MAG: TonB-dependent receptor [Novosphingobium sp.]|nr:TonB-dependent receptor [Novosphingobium sp.]
MAGSSLIALTLLGIAAPVLAQAQQAATDTAEAPAQVETPSATDQAGAIIVTGYRAALESAQKKKRNSNTIVDSISADDIGALPDRSVTETLQRIPGISINRFAAGVDPDHFAAEGSGVVVRGLTYVRSEFNGRDAFTANNGRGLGFADIPAELLGGVDVYKALPSDRIEGGIAGTVDLRTRKPFDRNGPFFAASIENNYGDFVKKSAPTVSVVGSTRFETPIGDIGILGSFNYSQLFTRADRIAISRFRPIPLNAAGQQILPVGSAPAASYGLIPAGAVAGSQSFNRERIGGSAALQWRSNDGALEATFEFLRTEAKQNWGEYTVEVATDNVDSNGGAFAAPGTQFSFDNSGVFTNGVITGATGWRADADFATGFGRVPGFGLQSNNIRRGHVENNIVKDYSANLKWKASERLTATFDYQHVDSTVNVIDNTIWASTYQNAKITNNGFDLPVIELLPVQNCSPNCPNGVGSQTYFTGTHQSFTDPYNSFWRSSMDHEEQSEGQSDAARLDLLYTFDDDSFINSIKAGYRYAKRDQIARFSAYNWGVLSEQWGNGGPRWLDSAVAQQAPGYEVFSFPNFFGGKTPSPAGAGRLFYAGNPATDIEAYRAYALAINQTWNNGEGWRPLPQRNGVIPGTSYLPGEINSAEEQNNAAYIIANFGKDLGGDKRISGNIGLRYTRTDRKAFGGSFIAQAANQFATQLAACSVVQPGGQPNNSPFCRLPADVQQALVASDTGGVSAFVPSVADLRYEYWLPSFNVRLEAGNGLQFRAAYFKGVTAPEFGLTRNYQRIDQISVRADQAVNNNAPFLTGNIVAGNPFLKPIEADNFDITGEYYFGNGGQFTVALFYKRLKNVLTNAQRSTQIAVGSATAFVNSTQPINSPDVGKIKGFEVAYQQNYTFLPGMLSGLGLQANYTFVDSQGVPQSTLNPTDPDVAAGLVSTIPGDTFPLQGLSRHTFNIVPYYEKGPITIRAAYSWRSQFLLTLRDVITPFDPIFQRPYGQLDASVFLRVNDNFTLGVQGVNLLDSLVKTAAAVYDRPAADPNKKILLVPRQWYKTDRRFTLSGLSAHWGRSKGRSDRLAHRLCPEV